LAPSPALNRLVVPVERQAYAGVTTGLSFQGGDEPVVLTLTMYDPSSYPRRFVRRLRVPAHSHVSRYLEEIFPIFTESIAATLEVRTDGGRVALTAVRFGRARGDFRVLPVLEIQ
jgi:hypothetical protein